MLIDDSYNVRKVTVTRQRLGVYVDGFNLYHGIHDWSRCRLLWLDLVKLAQSLRPTYELAALHYFTAPVLNDPRAASRQQAYQRALMAANPGLVQITQGRYQTKTYTCRKCGNQHRTYEEKETDVSIAVNLVADAARARFDAAMIISADSDLIPAMRAARDLKPDLFLVAAFPPKRNSDEVKRLLPASFHIGKAKVRDAQLPERVTDASGRVFERPAKWRATVGTALDAGSTSSSPL